jgi:hypothetical protein
VFVISCPASRRIISGRDNLFLEEEEFLVALFVFFLDQEHNSCAEIGAVSF